MVAEYLRRLPGRRPGPSFNRDGAVNDLPSDVDTVVLDGLDKAEFYFRRVVNLLPAYTLGRVNLGSVYLDKRKREQASSRDSSKEVEQNNLTLVTADPSRMPALLTPLLAQVRPVPSLRCSLAPWPPGASAPTNIKLF